MPMGIVSNEDFEKEIKNSHVPIPDEISNNGTVEDIQRGRKKDSKEVPEDIRTLAAISAINGEGTGKEIAEAYGISPSSVSAYKVGAHSTNSYSEPNSNLLDKITDHKAKISKKARIRLMSALNHITPEKLENIKAIELSAIAKNMAAIVSDMEPAVPANQMNQQNNVQVVFMAPRVKKIDEYQIIQVPD